MLVARAIAKLEPGGAQLGAFRLTRALEAHGIGCRFIAGDATPDGLQLAREHSIEVESFSEGLGLQWIPSDEFAAWLAPRLRGADLVHAHMFGAWWAAAQVVAPDVPLVASEHNAFTWPEGCCHDEEARQALRRVDLFYAHGPSAARHVRELGLPRERLAAGVGTVAGLGARPKPGLPARRIVYTGRLAPDKGPDMLVEALGRMADPPPAYLVGSGKLEAPLRERAAALGLDGKVHLPGWQQEPGPWIAGASALVLPSRHEAWSQSAVLAMGLGVPVVGFAVEGLPELLGDGRGVLVPPGDVDALAQAIDDVVAGRRIPDVEAGRRLAARHVPARVAPGYAAAYARLVARSTRSRTASAMSGLSANTPSTPSR